MKIASLYFSPLIEAFLSLFVKQTAFQQLCYEVFLDGFTLY